MSVEQMKNELSAIFKKYDLTLNDNYLNLNAQMFEVIRQLTHDKLSTSEMFNAYDFLSDVILQKKPQVAVCVLKNDRIKIQYRLMEEIKETRGKLTRDEKIDFAFCVFYSTCINIFDEETNNIREGIYDITSVEKVLLLKKEAMKSNPERFDIVDDTPYNDMGPFAYSQDNPVLATSVAAGYKYLDALRSLDGSPVPYKRLGSVTSDDGNIFDKYALTASESVIIYINPYANINSTLPPAGFRVK